MRGFRGGAPTFMRGFGAGAPTFMRGNLAKSAGVFRSLAAPVCRGFSGDVLTVTASSWPG
jgi:hypothetical protein